MTIIRRRWDGYGSEAGDGVYPVWNSANTSDGTAWSCAASAAAGPAGRYFRALESVMTIQNPGVRSA